MDTTRAFTDDLFLEAFLVCRLPPSAFNHRNHLRVAWIHLQRFPLDEATMTEALIRLMANAGASDPSVSFEEFLARAPAFSGDWRTLIDAHYSSALLARSDARYRFLSPDRLALPS
jgi:hypothetical protein